MTLKFKILDDRAVLPKYAHGPHEDAGMDLVAIETAILLPHVPTKIRTGLAMELPGGYEGQIRPRSGLAARHGISIPNSPGTIDPSFRNELCALLVWHGYEPNVWRWKTLDDPAQPWSGIETYQPECFSQACEFGYLVAPGDRIAQLVIAKYEATVPYAVSTLSESRRGINGFGSTGR